MWLGGAHVSGVPETRGGSCPGGAPLLSPRRKCLRRPLDPRRVLASTGVYSRVIVWEGKYPVPRHSSTCLLPHDDAGTISSGMVYLRGRMQALGSPRSFEASLVSRSERPSGGSVTVPLPRDKGIGRHLGTFRVSISRFTWIGNCRSQDWQIFRVNRSFPRTLVEWSRCNASARCFRSRTTPS